jgi:hypothetical protein
MLAFGLAVALFALPAWVDRLALSSAAIPAVGIVICEVKKVLVFRRDLRELRELQPK